MTASKRFSHSVRKTPAAGARPAGKPKSKRAPRKGEAARDGLAGLIAAALDGLKAQNIAVFDVRGLSDVTDTIVIASGTSDRHVKSLAGRVLERAREAGVRPLGLEGERDGEWVLVDLQDVVVHVMLPRVREFYSLEKLWDMRASDRDARR